MATFRSGIMGNLHFSVILLKNFSFFHKRHVIVVFVFGDKTVKCESEGHLKEANSAQPGLPTLYSMALIPTLPFISSAAPLHSSV